MKGLYLLIAVLLPVLMPNRTIAQTGMPRPIVVYKTKKDYYDKVPVSLSADRLKVESYPDPADLRNSSSGYPFPTRLRKGYLFDNRGVGVRTVFLNMSYEQYAALKEAPDAEAIMGMITDKEPMQALYICGNAGDFKDPVQELNKAIRKNKLHKKYKRMI